MGEVSDDVEGAMVKIYWKMTLMLEVANKKKFKLTFNWQKKLMLWNVW